MYHDEGDEGGEDDPAGQRRNEVDRVGAADRAHDADRSQPHHEAAFDRAEAGVRHQAQQRRRDDGGERGGGDHPKRRFGKDDQKRGDDDDTAADTEQHGGHARDESDPEDHRLSRGRRETDGEHAVGAGLRRGDEAPSHQDEQSGKADAQRAIGDAREHAAADP